MTNEEIQPEPSRRRREILDEAVALFLEKGYAGTSMSALAAACGVRKASLYHHFPSKEALFIACVTDGYDVSTRALRAIRDDPNLTHEERIRRAIDAIYEITIHAPAGRMSPLIAEVSRRIPEVARAFHDGFIEQQHELMNDIIDAGVASGVFVREDRMGMEHMIFGPVVTLSLSREMFASFDTLDELYPVDEIRESHAEFILKLLRPAPGNA